MTPERLGEIQHQVELNKVKLAAGSSTMMDLTNFVPDLLSALDAQSAEIETLKAWITEAKEVLEAGKELRTAFVEQNTALRTRLSAIEKYRKFFDSIVEQLMDAALEIESDCIVDTGVALGLMARMEYDPNNETMVNFCADFPATPDEGDKFWYVVGADPAIDALAALLEKGDSNES